MAKAGKAFGIVGAIAALALSCGLYGQFHRNTAGTPVRASAPFDYYILSLSWAPEFCAQPGAAAANPRECAAGASGKFVPHGLWPEANQGASSESCGPAGTLSKGLVNQLLPYMPSAELIRHEWATHGTCTGLSQDEYFTRVLLARAAVQIPVQISSIERTETNSPASIEAQFEGSNPSFPKGAFRVACRAGALTEIRACFDKGLKPRACAATAGECGSSMITIRSAR